mgnify:CR=1 FL=1
MTDLLDVIEEGIKKQNKTGKAMCQMCGTILSKDYDCNVCKECLDDSFPSDEDELQFRIKHKMCDKCHGEGNYCTKIRNHSICGLCQLEGFK